jgi:60 kDa SS-A/Ro ribonucleoprotein
LIFVLGVAGGYFWYEKYRQRLFQEKSMRTNTKVTADARTHEGAPTFSSTPAKELRRAVMANMLWENTFYESGIDIGQRIADLIPRVSFDEVAAIAIDAREKMKLRHVPLLLVRELLRKNGGRQMGDLIARVIQRPDELGELLALYWKDGKDQPLTRQMKVGLARALKKFDGYALAKWNGGDSAVKLRDVLFLTHAKPKDETQTALFKALAENRLTTPDTWEVALSGGADKRQTFERLIDENKLGALALLRNLRNMIESGVPEDKIRGALSAMKTERVLPFRFISAAKYAPRLEDALEAAMFKCLAEVRRQDCASDRPLWLQQQCSSALPKFGGKTALLIDHSGSMNAPVSGKSQIDRFDAACAIGMILRECAERVRVFAFSTETVEVPPRRGFALIEAAKNCMSFGGTSLGQAVRFVYDKFPECERLIVITDEQSMDRPQHPRGSGYIVNVAGNQNGIAYGPWVSIDGWSEAVLAYIAEYEANP